MKVAKITLFALLAALVAVGVSTTSYAFHSGGVAECTGCHSMHSPKAGGSFLLIGSDQSSTCLTCHMHAGDTGPSSYHIMTPDSDAPVGVAPKQRTPGGDFGWLRKTYTFSVRGTPNTEVGATHGHNVVATDFGMAADPTNITAPGQTAGYPASQLGCQSCHDPHSALRRDSSGAYVRGGVINAATAPIIASGSYNNSATPAAGQAVGVYRLLRGTGDTYGNLSWSAVGIAVAPSTYNQTEVTNQVRVAYGHAGTNTWGQWCGTCHNSMHSGTASVTTHAVDTNLNSYTNIYNAYVMSGDLSGTANSFTSLVPFAENTGDISILKSHASNTNAYLNGPATNDKVMCLSCHRAHASAFPEMLRWNMENEFMTTTTAGTTKYQIEDRGRTATEAVASYYDRPATKFASFQRVLCNKCHAKD